MTTMIFTALAFIFGAALGGPGVGVIFAVAVLCFVGHVHNDTKGFHE